MQLSVEGGLLPPLAGIVVMSGYLPHESGFEVTPGLEGTPIWHNHGSADPLVRMEMAEESRSAATKQGATSYTLKTYAGLAHSVNPQEIADVLAFLRGILPPDDSCGITLKDPGEMSVKELKAAINKAGLGRQAVWCDDIERGNCSTKVIALGIKIAVHIAESAIGSRDSMDILLGWC